MWNFYQPTDIIFGEGEIRRIKNHLKRLNLHNPIILSDPFQSIMDISTTIQQDIGIKTIRIVSEVEPNPSIENVDNLAEQAKEQNADCIIAVGGGSAIDCAKLAAVVVGCAKNTREILEGKTIENVIPIIAVPTTAGTGSEVTAVSIVSDKKNGVKKSLANPGFFPKLAIVDPVLTYTCPKKVTASSGIDALMHALDAMSSKKANPSTDAVALYASKIVFETLEHLVNNENDTEARNKMAVASLLAGMAFSQTGTTGSHACSYHITAKYNIPHGEACALTADEWYMINAEVRPELNNFAKQLGLNDARGLSEELNRIKKAIGLRATLSECGIPELDIAEVAQKATEAGNAPNNIYPITSGLVESILERIK
ncbi:NAD-dependent methanol dehydrogenase [Clostridium homopropionicum DSM 5847]|uniref:NAD-dependent methanol dehydrogenase n=1 Tax=Clostridium homopropionicum DSM 5847 TaxID=1121318 RepID=A0A0L6ZAC4_9CLOT|nr:iron-containing alcohol dehydrogenase family protein [Clostridium homopropionicum]KOA19718.1 NAD-dependent methanol dehydrogenase [Clostridium homopropionicum DSM 5847]SFF79177.1 alcohol dehydrogenase [Clostridium homopropionicum]